MSAPEFLVNTELERAVLGHLLVGGLPVYERAGLSREVFYHVFNQAIYDAVTAISARGGQADLPLVGAELRATGRLEDVGPAYLSGLTDDAIRPSFETALVGVARLEEAAARRAQWQALTMLATDLKTKPETLAFVSDRLSDIDAMGLVQRGADVLDVAGQLAAFHTERQRGQLGKVWLGFPTLDDTMGGIRPGEVCGLMARPGVGKTLLLCNIAHAVAGVSPVGQVFFSLEMPSAQIVGRLQRLVYQLGVHELADAAETLDPVAYRDHFASLMVVGTPGLSVAQMGNILRRLELGVFADRRLGLVVIDHLGLIGGDRKQTTYDRVSTQAREIKELAKRHHCAVLLAVQVNRDQGGDGSRELGLGAARDSGVVEEAMDYLLTVRRLDRNRDLSPFERRRYEDVLFTRLVKNRHGELGDEIGLRLNPRTLAIQEDRNARADENDLARIAGGRRR
jgi:replicative DNA helicase